MKTAGVVVDFYDDLSGDLLKKAFPSVEDIPEIIKTAHILTPEERSVLRDEAYALIMYNQGVPFRKFACVDEGNTVLSVLYFMQNHDKLPNEAIKLAAANLLDWCDEYGLAAPEMLKIAKKNGMGKSRDPAKQQSVSDEADWSQRTNIASVQGNSDTGRVGSAVSEKNAHAVGSNKSFGEAVRGEKVPHIKADINLDSFHKLNPEAKPPKKKKHAGVDVTGQEPDLFIKRASADRTALGGRYPLDSMSDLQKAIEYFADNYKNMDPVEAHIFAVKTAARAEELGLKVSEDMERYGSTEYASDVDAHLSNRIAVTPPDYKDMYQDLREKRASIDPEDFAELLKEADEVSGLKWVWGGEVADPYYATFGKTANAWSWQSRTGDFVSAEELSRLARNGRPLIHKHFSSEMCNAFMKDPIAIFESLPDDTKVILARLAADKFDGLKTN